MDGNEFMNLAVAVVSLVLGGIVSWVVTKHHYDKGSRASLATFAFTGEPFIPPHEATRDQIQIAFDGRQVANICAVDVLVVNDGFRSIGSSTPIVLDVPSGVSVLAAYVYDRIPEEMVIKLVTGPATAGLPTEVKISCDLLDSGQWFMLRLLATDEVEASEMRVHATIEGIPSRTSSPSGDYAELYSLMYPPNYRLEALKGIMGLFLAGLTSYAAWTLVFQAALVSALKWSQSARYAVAAGLVLIALVVVLASAQKVWTWLRAILNPRASLQGFPDLY